MGKTAQYDCFCCFQKWRKELAKNREKLLGGSDKEKDKKIMEKEKEEKKDKKEVWRTTIRHLNCLTLKYQCYSLFLGGGGV